MIPMVIVVKVVVEVVMPVVKKDVRLRLAIDDIRLGLIVLLNNYRSLLDNGVGLR